MNGKHTKQQEWKLERLDELREEKDNLDNKKEDGKLSREEGARLEEVKKNLSDKRIVLNGKEYSLEVRTPKDTTHIILSIGGKHSAAKTKRATDAVREFLGKNFGDVGYRYVFAMHTDTDNLHAHFIVKNVNEMTRKRLHLDKADLFILRQDLGRELSSRGIERSATMRMDRAKTVARIHEGVEQVRERHSWYQTQLEKGREGFSNFNIATYRNFTLSKAQRLIKGVQKELQKFDYRGDRQALKKDLKYLREFKKDLMKVTPARFNIEKESLLKKIDTDNIILFKKIEELKRPNELKIQGKGILIKTGNEIYLKEYVKKHEKEVEVALDYMKDHKGLAPKKKQRNIEIIQSLKAIREKTIGKGKGMSREKSLF